MDRDAIIRPARGGILKTDSWFPIPKHSRETELSHFNALSNLFSVGLTGNYAVGQFTCGHK